MPGCLRTWSWFCRTTGLEHFQHAIGDEKPANDVDGGGDDGQHSQDERQLAFVTADQNDGADYSDGVESVGDGHQRGVQERRDALDDFKADEAGQHEYEETVD